LRIDETHVGFVYERRGIQTGVGGMGEVYRACDTALQRDVAIKLLPVTVASDPERLARFKREAQLLASLSHPHIATIYGLEPIDAGPDTGFRNEGSDQPGFSFDFRSGPTAGPARQSRTARSSYRDDAACGAGEWTVPRGNTR
jgi:serine/threonine protein kinase